MYDWWSDIHGRKCKIYSTVSAVAYQGMTGGVIYTEDHVRNKVQFLLLLNIRHMTGNFVVICIYYPRTEVHRCMAVV